MKEKHAARIQVGTSGWSYAHWRGRFYPPDLPQKQWLGFYGAHLETVEINSSFYRLPASDTLRAWAAAVPEQFSFSVKASRYITHMKKLADAKKSTGMFLSRISVLGRRLGPILFQLPPRWNLDLERLDRFLRTLSREFRYAFEFRDRRWITDETLALLMERQAAFCVYDLEGYLAPRAVTTDFVYVRLHGPNGAYRGKYDAKVLAGWAGAFASWAGQGRRVYCYFNNDQRAYAAENAARLRSMVAA